ncbi:hypothetical protein NS226_17425 [Aureimonas ureilytica]|uniref:Uncharacterized protein n=1 Tax=Aureimonas ureilytica TaxID=401562 RepID=A0A175R5N6_9HYPH|nr:hypothetical protein NS226_17425 [Aureimonas ureilytica]
MQRSDAEVGVAPGAVAGRVQPLGDLLDAERARPPVAVPVETKDHLDSLGLDRVDRELLLDAGAALLDLFRAIAERHGRAVVESLPGVFLHRAKNVLGVLAALILVKQGDHLPHHHLRGVVAELLRDRHQPHADLSKAADVHLQAEAVAEEARVGVNDDDVEWAVAVGGALDHALELGPRVVGGRRAGLDVFGEKRPALGLAEVGDLFALVGDRQVALRLPTGGDAKVGAGAHGAERPRFIDRHARGDTHAQLSSIKVLSSLAN